jgi:ADP-ribose pyrophosphatase YjhB (NUDIX family)
MADPPPMNYCPRCGQPLVDAVRFGKTRRMCEACGFIHFQDPKVAAVVLITEAKRVLLVRRAVDPQIGKWALPAGYIDYGEDPREAAVREVSEETGLQVRITRLIDILGPDEKDGNPASIVILFEAVPVGGELSAQDDIAEAIFFDAGSLPAAGEIAFESTRLLLSLWLASLPKV